MKNLNLSAFLVLFLITCFLLPSTAQASQMPEKVAFLRNEVAKKIRIKKTAYWLSMDENLSEEEFSQKLLLLQSKRKKLISQLLRLISKSKSSTQKVNLNLRLARLYVEQYYAELTRAYRVFERELASFKKKKGKRKKVEPRLKKIRATRALNKARAIYKRLLAQYPRDSRRDEMLYFYANSSMDKGLIREGLATFKKLINQHPNSEFVFDALTQLGDYYFEKTWFNTAQKYYDSLIRLKYKPLIFYAKYKKAWCVYNLKNPIKALRIWKWIIENDSPENASVAVHIRKEALSDITLPFVDLKMVKKSIAFFQSFSDQEYRDALQKMASLYRDRGQYRYALRLWKTLIELDSAHPSNPEHEIEIVNSLRLANKLNKSLARLFSRLPIYLEEESDWYDHNSSDSALLKKTRNSFEKIARTYALEQHSTGQKVKNIAFYKRAKSIYRHYLKYFSKYPDSAKIRFNLAEIYFKDKEYESAVNHYYRVYQDVGTIKLGKDSLSAALASLDQLLNLERKLLGLHSISARTETKLDKSEPIPEFPTTLTPTEAQFIKLAEEFLKEYPREKNSPEVLYEQAYLYYWHYNFKRASLRFWKLVSMFPSHPTTYSAAHLLMDIHNRKNEYPELISVCKKILSNKNITWIKLKKEVSNVLRIAELKRIEKMEQDGLFLKAANGYMWYTKKYGYQDEALFESALYNASVNFSKVHVYSLAIQAQEKLLQNFPKTRVKKQVIKQIAQNHEHLAQFPEAAKYLEKFSRLYKKDKYAKTAHRLAALYTWGAGNTRKAARMMKIHMDRHPQDRPLVEQDLLMLYESMGSLNKQLAFHRQKKNQKKISPTDFLSHSVQLAEVYAQKNGRIPSVLMKNTVAFAQKHKRSLRRSPRGISLLSNVLFWSIHNKERSFRNLKLNVSENRLAKRLQKKLSLLKSLEKDYSHLASFGDAHWGLGAIYQTASLYQSAIYSVLQAPTPKSLTAEQLNYYHSEIQQTILTPLSEKVTELINKCMVKAEEFQLLSPWASRCYSMASKINPQDYPQLRTLALPALETALILPDPKQSKIKTGNIKRFKYPYYASYLFPHSNRGKLSPSTKPTDLGYYYQEIRDLSGANRSIPTSFSYQSLAKLREKVLHSELSRLKPSGKNQIKSFAYLNLLRLNSPGKAIPLIQRAIRRDPHSLALHNLLGLTYLEMGNIPAAQVTWLSLLARGHAHNAIWNNLGVISVLRNDEIQAQKHFREATQSGKSKEAYTNLAFLHLKYRNASSAKSFFESAVENGGTDSHVRVGHIVAQLQSGEYDEAKDKLSSLTDQFRSDPYARLSVAYFLLDIEKDFDLAGQILAEYIKKQSSKENLIPFRRALNESHKNSAIMAIPTLPVPEVIE